MPYKNPEDKRRWEREHRGQRNAQRRAQRLGLHKTRMVPEPMPRTLSDGKPKGVWKIILALAVGFGVALLSGLSEVRLTKEL